MNNEHINERPGAYVLGNGHTSIGAGKPEPLFLCGGITHAVAGYRDLLSRKQAAEYLGVCEQTLAIWKCTGRYNLPFVKIGRLVKYRKVDLDTFINRHLTDLTKTNQL